MENATQYVDAEYTNEQGFDPGTGELMNVSSAAMARMNDAGSRGHMAIGAPAALAMAVKEKSLMEARMSIARERPRDWMLVRARLLKECERPGFADAAIYSKPVGGGQTHEDMSIRFAEACIRYMGNVRTTTELVEDEPRKVVYRVTVMDLESGSSFDDEITISKTVERTFLKDGQMALSERKNSRGKSSFLVLATDDDIANKRGSAASKSIRNSVKRLMPGDIFDECRQRCEATLANAAAKSPNVARNALLDSFGALGISPKQIAEYLGKETAEAISPMEVTQMRRIYHALKDQEVTWPTVMENRPNKPAAAAPMAPPVPVVSPIAPAAAPVAAPPPSPAPVVDTPAANPVQNSPAESDPVENEKTSIRNVMRGAKSRKELQPLLARIRALPADDQKGLQHEYQEVAKNVQ